MNYDLCDLLNRKMESLFGYYDEKNFTRSSYKHVNFLDDYLEKKYPEAYIELLENEKNNESTYAVWIFRNGLFSNQIADFDVSAKKITRELANLTYSNNPSIDIMYFSGVMKMVFSKNKSIYLETCSKPSLDQLMALKDFEKNIFSNNSITVWKIIDRKSKNTFYEGQGLEKLFGFNWSRIK